MTGAADEREGTSLTVTELRDRFACIALIGLVPNYGSVMAAREAYKYADEMMKAREKGPAG